VQGVDIDRRRPSVSPHWEQQRGKWDRGNGKPGVMWRAHSSLNDGIRPMEPARPSVPSFSVNKTAL
jgi:hypothetical protein